MIGERARDPRLRMFVIVLGVWALAWFLRRER